MFTYISARISKNITRITSEGVSESEWALLTQYAVNLTPVWYFPTNSNLIKSYKNKINIHEWKDDLATVSHNTFCKQSARVVFSAMFTQVSGACTARSSSPWWWRSRVEPTVLLLTSRRREKNKRSSTERSFLKSDVKAVTLVHFVVFLRQQDATTRSFRSCQRRVKISCQLAN